MANLDNGAMGEVSIQQILDCFKDGGSRTLNRRPRLMSPRCLRLFGKGDELLIGNAPTGQPAKEQTMRQQGEALLEGAPMPATPGNSNENGSTIEFREVNAETWPDLDALFESRGGPKACWCLVWRDYKRKGDKRALKEYVDAGTPIGLLGYVENEPVAWCSIAPRPTYRAGLADVLAEDVNEDVWSLACFFVKRRHRGRGMFRALLLAAEDQAKARGATVLEAYPVDADSPSYRFGGFLHAFEREGYEAIGRAGTRRHVVRRRLNEPR